jgi:anti-anti-sigma regulatory factor
MTAVSNEHGVVTLRFDATRASLGATGALDSAAAGVLAGAVNEHIVAHRRYVRLDLSGVTSVDDAAVAVLAEIHSRLLAERGTLILTGVDSWLEIVLAGPECAFLMIAPTAADGAEGGG